MMKLLTQIAAIFLPGLLMLACSPGQDKSEQERPNVLFVMFDDLGRHLSSYGDPNARKFRLTPNFESLSREGLQFSNAYCQAAVCGPSRASILTGLRPDVTLVNTDHVKSWMYEEDSAPRFYEIIENHPTINNFFRNHGYYTARSGKIHHEDGIYRNLDWEPTDYEMEADAIPWLGEPGKKHHTDAMGFPSYYQDTLNPITKNCLNPWLNGVTQSRTTIWEMHVDYDKYDPYRNRNMLWTQRALDAMEKAVAQKKPFFVACGIVANHDPYCQPKEFADMIDPMQIELPETSGMKYKGTRPVDWAYYGGMRPWSDGTSNWDSMEDYLLRQNVPDNPWEGNAFPSDPGDIKEEAIRRKLLQSYYASVAYSDFLLGVMLDKLKELKIEDNTIVAVVSDHGFHILDHDVWNKTTQFRFSTASVAFLKTPASWKQKQGFKIEDPVELLDFYPTLADLCGLQVPKSLQGKSLKPYMDHSDEPSEKYAFSQYSKNGQMGYSIFSKRYRYTAWLDNPDGVHGDINTAPEYGPLMMEELYDFENDPFETVNLAQTEAFTAIKDKLKNELNNFIHHESAKVPEGL